jgi:DNA-binding NtrC family response regulator
MIENSGVHIERAAGTSRALPAAADRHSQIREASELVGRARTEVALVRSEITRRDRHGAMVGGSRPMLELFQKLDRLKDSLVTVLIEGESGSGKELVARSLHEQSSVAGGPFIAVNCGALERELARSELFGHRKGAFTGAADAHVGAFEAADGGTLFLDEVGDLPLDVQPTLLRALQNRAVVRVGESSERPVSVRVVAATHRSLWHEVAAGRFREDLYFRLAVVTLNVPPLRERSEDIEPLARHIANRLGVSPLPNSALEELRKRPWPGNVRELHNVIEHYAALGTLPSGSRPAVNLATAVEALVDPSLTYAEHKRQLLECFQRAYFRKLLVRTAGNQSEAARLAAVERSYLSKLIKQLSVDGGEASDLPLPLAAG